MWLYWGGRVLITLSEMLRSEESVFSKCHANHDEERYAHVHPLLGTKTVIRGLK